MTKKMLTFLGLAAALTFGVGCSSDSNDDNDNMDSSIPTGGQTGSNPGPTLSPTGETLPPSFETTTP